MRPRFLLTLMAGLLLLAGRSDAAVFPWPDRSDSQAIAPTPDDWRDLQLTLSRLASAGALNMEVDLLRAYIERTTDTQVRLVAMGELVDVLRDPRLNRLSDAETLARQILEAQPSEPLSYVQLSHILSDQGRLADAAAIMRAERTHVPDTPAQALYWSELAENLIEQVRQSPQPGRDAASRLLSEASDANTQALRLLEKNPSHSDVDMSVALGDRALILDLQAALVEQSDTGRAALTAESQRLAKESAAVLAKPPATASGPSPVEDEWRTTYQQASQLFHDGKFEDGAEVIRVFMRSHPDFRPARIALGVFHMQHVSDDKTMTRELAHTSLTAAVAVLDEALQRNPDDVDALTYKALVLRLRAERVETDAERAKTLTTEADRLLDRAKELNRLRQR